MQQALCGSLGRGLSQPNGGGILGPAAPMGEGSHDQPQTVMGMDDGMHGGGGGGFPISGISAFLQGHHPSVHLVKTEGAGGGASALQHLNQQPRHVSAGEGPTEGETAPACSGSDAGQASGFGGGSAGAGFTQAPHMRFFKKEEGSTAKESGRVGTGSEGGSSGGGGGSGSKGHKKRAWVAAEDGLMKQLVETHGPKDWNYISGQLQGRSAKQCCERWHNYLKPDIRKDAWRPEEDRLIMDYHHSFCNKWSKIAEYLPGRTGNSVKNRYYRLLRRNRKGSGSGDGDGNDNGASTPSAASVASSSTVATGNDAEGDALQDTVGQRGGGRLARADAGEAAAEERGGHGGGVSSYAQPQHQHHQPQHQHPHQHHHQHQPWPGGAGGGEQHQQQQEHHHHQQQQQQQQTAGGYHQAYEMAPPPAGEAVHYTWTPIGWATTTTASVPFPPSPDHSLFSAAAAHHHHHQPQPPQQQFSYATAPINEAAASDHNTHANTGATTVVMGAAAAADFYYTHPSSPQQPLSASAPQDLRISPSSSTQGGPGGGQTTSLSFAASYGGGGRDGFPAPMTTSQGYAQQARGGRLSLGP